MIQCDGQVLLEIAWRNYGAVKKGDGSCSRTFEVVIKWVWEDETVQEY